MFFSGLSQHPTRVTAIVGAPERAARWLKAFALLEDAPVVQASHALDPTNIATETSRGRLGGRLPSSADVLRGPARGSASDRPVQPAEAPNVARAPRRPGTTGPHPHPHPHPHRRPLRMTHRTRDRRPGGPMTAAHAHPCTSPARSAAAEGRRPTTEHR